MIVDALTHSSSWSSTAIFVLPDGAATSSPDHVDSRRTYAVVISPYARRGYVGMHHLSSASVLKTEEELLGLPALSLGDDLAGDMHDFFVDAPNVAPFTAMAVRATPGGLSPQAANKPPVVTGSLTLQPPFSAGDGSTLAAALLLRPSAGIESLPSLQSEPGAIYPRAIEQFDGLVTALRQCGVQTVVLEAPADDGPVAAGVVVADLAVVLPNGAVLMRPSDPIVRAQVARIEAALEKAGVPVIGRIEAPGLLDGGDVLIGPDALYVGVPQDRASRTGIARGPHGNEFGAASWPRSPPMPGSRRSRSALPATSRGCAPSPRSSIAPRSSRRRASSTSLRSRASSASTPPVGEEYGAGVLAVGRRRVIANVPLPLPVRCPAPGTCRGRRDRPLGIREVRRHPSMLALALKRDLTAMRIAIFSDIHGNVRGLDACLADWRARRRGPNRRRRRLLSRRTPSREVLQRLDDVGAVCVKGNTDRYIAENPATMKKKAARSVGNAKVSVSGGGRGSATCRSR